MATFGLFGEDTQDSDENKSDDEKESKVKSSEDLKDCEVTKDRKNISNKDSDVNDRKDKSDNRSKWSQALDEYDCSSFVQNLVGSTSSDCSRKIISREECVSTLPKTYHNQSQDYYNNYTFHKHKKQPSTSKKEEDPKLAEILQLKKEIQEDRNRWQPLYSDEESEQNELVGKIRRSKKLKAKSDGINGYAKGEGWKKLKLMAETKVKNNPEKYSSISKHKFPLRP